MNIIVVELVLGWLLTLLYGVYMFQTSIRRTQKVLWYWFLAFVIFAPLCITSHWKTVGVVWVLYGLFAAIVLWRRNKFWLNLVNWPKEILKCIVLGPLVLRIVLMK